jgi:ClpP class serine protease
MRFQRIHEAIHHQPWFISVAGYSGVKALYDHAMREHARNADYDEALSDFVRRRPDMSIDENGIATIYIFGVLGKHLSNIEQACGNTGYEEIEREIAIASRTAKAIFFVFDSPGGQVVGCDETARSISECPLPKLAFTDTQIASAAYYLASGCDSIVATRSAQVGNIGIIIPRIDESKLWELEGMQFAPIFNEGADLKSTGHGPSLTPTQIEFLQAMVNQNGSMFQEHVFSHRSWIDSEVWRAGWYSGEKAQELGLIDAIGNEAQARAALNMM